MRTKQRPSIILPMCLLQTTLVFQERGALRVEHREGAQRRIHHRIHRVFARPPIGEGLERTAHLLRDVVQGQDTRTKGHAHWRISALCVQLL